MVGGFQPGSRPRWLTSVGTTSEQCAPPGMAHVNNARIPLSHTRTLLLQLKGLSKEETEAQIQDLLQQIDLQDKRTQFSSKLSGGMKRKLHVAISLIGNSKVSQCTPG